MVSQQDSVDNLLLDLEVNLQEWVLEEEQVSDNSQLADLEANPLVEDSDRPLVLEDNLLAVDLDKPPHSVGSNKHQALLDKLNNKHLYLANQVEWDNQLDYSVNNLNNNNNLDSPNNSHLFSDKLNNNPNNRHLLVRIHKVHLHLGEMLKHKVQDSKVLQCLLQLHLY